MDPNLLENMLTAHQEFLNKLGEAADSIRKSETPSADALKVKEQLLGVEKQRLESVKESKQQAVGRFDTEIQNQTARIKSLEKEIEDDKKVVQSPQKAVPVGARKTMASTAKAPKGRKKAAKRTARGKKKSG